MIFGNDLFPVRILILDFRHSTLNVSKKGGNLNAILPLPRYMRNAVLS